MVFYSGFCFTRCKNYRRSHAQLTAMGKEAPTNFLQLFQLQHSFGPANHEGIPVNDPTLEGQSHFFMLKKKTFPFLMARSYFL